MLLDTVAKARWYAVTPELPMLSKSLMADL